MRKRAGVACCLFPYKAEKSLINSITLEALESMFMRNGVSQSNCSMGTVQNHGS